jgi:hypothetical protein
MLMQHLQVGRQDIDSALNLPIARFIATVSEHILRNELVLDLFHN